MASRKASTLLVAASVLLALFAYDAVVQPVLSETVRLPNLPGGITTATSVLALFSLIHAWYALGGRLTLAFFALAAAISWAFEQVGVATGLVYGAYHYTDYLGPKLGHVPFLIPLAWFMMIYPSYVIANLIVARRAYLGRAGASAAGAGAGSGAGASGSGAGAGAAAGAWSRAGWLVVLAAVSAAVMTAWDLIVDPMLSGPQVKAWIWETGGPYFGIPIHNYAGWLLTTFTVYLAYRWLEGRTAHSSAGPVGPGVAALPLAAYGLMLVSDLVGGVAPQGAAAVGLAAMGIPLAVAAWRLRGAEATV
jgi:uncharacterized membrane protein